MLGTLPCPTLPYPNPEPNPEPPHPAPHHLTQPQPLPPTPTLPYPTPPNPYLTPVRPYTALPCREIPRRLFGWTETCILPGFHGNLFLELDATANIYHYNIPWEFEPNVISRHACPTIPYPSLPLYYVGPFRCFGSSVVHFGSWVRFGPFVPFRFVSVR